MNLLFEICIIPIEVVMRSVLSVTYSVMGDYGVSLILLSLFVNLAILPLYHVAGKWQMAERRIQSRLQPKLREFQQAFSGEERFSMIRTLYRQEGYHPIYAMRSLLGFLIQVPFFIAAYHLLSQYQPLQGASFLILDDLGQPDGLLWGVHLMPLLMTATNLLSVFVYTKNHSFNDRLQGWVIAAMFLVLLYNASSALLLYWTCNNIFSFIKNVAYIRWDAKSQTHTRYEAVSASSVQTQSTANIRSKLWQSQTVKTRTTMTQDILQSPYVLALLVGAYPIVFYLSNNWFMLKPAYAIILLVGFPLIIFLVLGSYHVVLIWGMKKLGANNSSRMIQRLFVLVCFFMLAYLLRDTILPMMDHRDSTFVTAVVVFACLMAWFIPTIRISRVNIVLGIMCVAQLGIGVNSIIAIPFMTKTNSLVGKGEDEARQTIYDQVKFSKRPNVYFIVPDGYPNQEALSRIFDIDGTDFYQSIEALGLTLYPQALSNYRSTTSSMSAAFGMQHHYYQGSIGNFELLYSREFITSEYNPVIRIFKKNEYQIHYVHEDDFLLTAGCFVDLCSPGVSLEEFRNILFPRALQLAPAIKPTHLEYRQNVLRHIEMIAAESQPHFLYVHMKIPSHSETSQQSPEELENFRNTYFKKIDIANESLMAFIQHIVTHDPKALIIINADHGAWGLGAYKLFKQVVFNGLSDDLIGLDHLGVLLAIRWPDGVPAYDQDIRTNINLFRYIFAYLHGREDILATKVFDHGYLTKGQGADGMLLEVARDGVVLNHFVDMGRVQ